METRTPKTARNRWRLAALLPLAFLLALPGCSTLQVQDLTPGVTKANASNTYTITTRIDPRPAVIESSIRPEIIIDGEARPMEPVPGQQNLYQHDYQMPPGRNEAAYYILVRYTRNTSAGTLEKERYTELQTLRVEGRYAMGLSVDRAPAGARVTVLGQGFGPNDRALVGGSSVQTRFESPNSISFVVPSLAEGRSYPVEVVGGGESIEVGSLRIDASKLRVSPSSLTLDAGERRALVFSVPEPAPPGGLRLDITTDIPASVIMPEVAIPAGQRSTSVTVEGGEPGSGSLFVEAGGLSEIVVPIAVR